MAEKRIRQRMFAQGERITSLDELFKLLDKEEYVYLNGVPKHPQWMLNMTVRRLGIAIQDKELHRAVKAPPIARKLPARRTRPAARKRAGRSTRPRARRR